MPQNGKKRKASEMSPSPEEVAAEATETLAEWRQAKDAYRSRQDDAALLQEGARLLGLFHSALRQQNEETAQVRENIEVLKEYIPKIEAAIENVGQCLRQLG